MKRIALFLSVGAVAMLLASVAMADNEFVPLKLDITPGKCPNDLRRNGLGKLKIALLGTEDFDVSVVDASTCLLTREDGVGGAVAPLTTPAPRILDRGTPFEGELCDCHSSRKDGHPDYLFSFLLSEVIDEFNLNDEPSGASVELVIECVTDDGTLVGGSDCAVLGQF